MDVSNGVFWMWIFNLFGSLYIMYDGLDDLERSKKNNGVQTEFDTRFGKFKIWFSIFVFPLAIFTLINAKLS